MDYIQLLPPFSFFLFLGLLKSEDLRKGAVQYGVINGVSIKSGEAFAPNLRGVTFQQTFERVTEIMQPTRKKAERLKEYFEGK